MKQRLGIAQAMLNHPKLLICDEIGVLNDGKLVAQGTMEKIRSLHPKGLARYKVMSAKSTTVILVWLIL